jgi:flagellar protein FliL
MADKAAKKKQGADGADGVDGEETGKKRGKRKLVVGAICVALAGGAYVIGSKSAAAPPTGADVTTTTIELFGGCKEEPKPGVPKTIIDLPEMSINLADGHYLRVAASLGLCADVVLAKPEAFLSAPAKDLVVATLSGLQMGALATTEGRDLAKQALTDAISAEYRGEVYQVYLVQFVMQ